jgi:hypothetical protein
MDGMLGSVGVVWGYVGVSVSVSMRFFVVQFLFFWSGRYFGGMHGECFRCRFTALKFKLLIYRFILSTSVGQPSSLYF